MLRREFFCCLLGTLTFVVSALSESAVANGPRVPGFVRFFEAPDSDVVRGGLLLLGELNCVACHAADSATTELAKQAPRLDEVGSRVRPEFLREFLMNPQHADSGTTMPHVLHGTSENERRQQVESIVHFLASTGRLSESAPVVAGVGRGDRLFHSVGCVACHHSIRGNSPSLPTSVPLPQLSRKYSIPSLAKFLQDPLHVRPSGRMPQFNLTAEEARDIACFLLRDLQIPASMTFQYYEGSWEKLPDFSRLAIKNSGGASSFDVEVGAADHFGVRFQGKFRVESAGQYRFYLTSDDGSRLLIDGREVLVHDGIHAADEMEAKVPLGAGTHDFVVEYFEGSGEQSLAVEYQGPGVQRQSLEFALVAPGTTQQKPQFVPDQMLVSQGREIFQKAGCAACHEMHVADKRLQPAKLSKKLSELESGGCLAVTPPGHAPSFDLSPKQRTALTKALGALRMGQPLLADSDKQVAHTLATFNCYACHDRQGIGGIEAERNPHFQTNQPEMGDEGRLPPTLTGVGAKLQASWFRQVFEKGTKDRPYMFTRMPRFDDSNVGSLTALLTQLDRASSQLPTQLVLSDPSTPDRKLKAIGRHLVGERGMSCVKCHTWGNVKATGIQAISLTTMTRRLDHDWFHQYLMNPQTYRPGTRMPAAWPNGQSPFSNILAGDAVQQIESVWKFLVDGNNAAMPIGIGTQPIELVPSGEPIIYRNFLDRAGPKGIAVGFPEHVHLAFDANDCRLALLWQGAFLDASMHWTGRGSGFQKPLGDNVLTMTEGVPFAALASMSDPWPKTPAREQGIAFRGYRLDSQRRPHFLYRWHEVQVEDTFLPVTFPSGSGIRRALQLRQLPADGAWFRASVATKIEPSADGWFVIDNDWRMRIVASAGKPQVRESEGKQELLAPLRTAGAHKPATLEIEFAW